VRVWRVIRARLAALGLALAFSAAAASARPALPDHLALYEAALRANGDEAALNRLAGLDVEAVFAAAPAREIPAPIPALPEPPGATWLTHDEALALRDQVVEAAIAGGELTGRPGAFAQTDALTQRTRFQLWGTPYPGPYADAPRWHELEAVRALMHGNGAIVEINGTAPDFTLSRDGRWIAMARADFPRNELYLIEVRTGEGWRLRYPVETLEFFHPEFSPTDDQIAVAVHAMPRLGLGEIWLLDLNGALVDRIVTPRHAPVSPDFSPDGRRLAFLQTAPWEVAPGAAGVSPEYASSGGGGYRLIVTDLETGARAEPADALFRGPVDAEVFFSADGAAVMAPRVWSQSLIGPRGYPGAPRLSYMGVLSSDLPRDAAAFFDRVDRFSREGQSFGLQAQLAPHGGPRLVQNPPSQFEGGGSSLIDTVCGRRLYVHHGQTVRTRRGDVIGSSQTLTLEDSAGHVQVLRSAPAGARLQDRVFLGSARVSEDLCTLAYYENDTRERPVIRVAPLCSDAAEITLDVEVIAARLTPLVTGWEVLND